MRILRYEPLSNEAFLQRHERFAGIIRSALRRGQRLPAAPGLRLYLSVQAKNSDDASTINGGTIEVLITVVPTTHLINSARAPESGQRAKASARDSLKCIAWRIGL